MVSFERPLKVGYCGASKIGKSHLAARFVKELDGVFLDYAGIQQYKPKVTEAPRYDVSHLSRGEAYTACLNAGIDIDKQYRFVKSWDDLEAAIEYARIYRDDLSKKENKRIWLIFDDTNLWRWHEAMHASKVSGNKSITKVDWGQATTNMVLRVRNLECEFNLLFVNQMGDKYKNGENTGELIGKFYPTGIEYALDVVGELWIDEEKKPKVQHFNVKANRSSWLCADDYIEDIINPQPKEMLRLMNISEDLW